MAHEFEETNGSNATSFMMGMLTGAVLGAGLGLLFAPKTGSETRQMLSDQANNLSRTASKQYEQATEAASTLVDKGRDLYGKAKEAVSRGADEARGYVREAERELAGAVSSVSNYRSEGH